jgi:hypothetical protein
MANPASAKPLAGWFDRGSLPDWPGLPVSPFGLALLCALLTGSLIAFGGPVALLLCVSLLVSLLILLDFRVGVVLLMLLFPLSASPSFPHGIGGITGLNPFNLLLFGTLVACLLSGRGLLRLIPGSLAGLYLLPIVLGGLLGMGHVGEIASELQDANLLSFDTPSGYLRDLLIKPLLMVVIALLIGAAAGASERPVRWLLAMLVVSWVISLLTVALVIVSGTSLGVLAGSGSREFFQPLGIHANDLGRLLTFAYALLLFTLGETRDGRLRFWLLASLALVVVALTLTFSRGAFFGFAVVNLLFLISRRHLAGVLIAFAMLAVLIALLPGAVFDRLTTGWGGGVNAVSAGRVEHIWLPLLDEFWRHPLIGNGLGSITWSDAMQRGQILLVTHPHNAYLQAALDLGLIGLLLLLSFFTVTWRQFRQLSRQADLDPLWRGFYAGAAAGLISLLIAGWVGGSLLPSIEQTFLWFALGLMYAQQQNREA